eukprot:5913692-Lingulodinium_polyedra.AAC.1
MPTGTALHHPATGETKDIDVTQFASLRFDEDGWGYLEPAATEVAPGPVWVKNVLEAKALKTNEGP